MIDVLGGALSGAGCSGSGTTIVQNGVLMMAINIAQFTPMEDFYGRVDALVEHVKASPPGARVSMRSWFPVKLSRVKRNSVRARGFQLMTKRGGKSKKQLQPLGYRRFRRHLES